MVPALLFYALAERQIIGGLTAAAQSRNERRDHTTPSTP
jgi:hypothetical protein